MNDDDLEDAYEGEIPESSYCMMCGLDDDDVLACDRWHFELEDDDYDYWICRHCHSRFNDVAEFDRFRKNWVISRLYRSAAELQQLLLKNAPACVISLFIKAIVSRAIHDEGELGCQVREDMKKIMSNGSIDKENMI